MATHLVKQNIILYLYNYTTSVNKYAIPRLIMEIYITILDTCNFKIGANCMLVVQNQFIVTKDFNERSQIIALIDFQSVPDEKFKLILNYQDHNTKFVCLRQYI
uniref:Uncharacterized protein n=1 Tax=Schizaphis graminum TaxID=13262 RepID=A0A2S2P6X4_SCHGA